MNASVLCTIIIDETDYKVPKCGERYFLVAKNKHTSIPRRAARRTSGKRIEEKIWRKKSVNDHQEYCLFFCTFMSFVEMWRANFD